MRKTALVVFIGVLCSFTLAHDYTTTSSGSYCSGTCSSSVLHQQQYRYKTVKTYEGYWSFGVVSATDTGRVPLPLERNSVVVGEVLALT